GINIAVVIDTSTSMMAEDLSFGGRRQNRLEAVKAVVADFIDARKDDRVALIAFAAKPYVVCPLTADHAWLKTNLDRINFGLMEDGTAIGSALASAVNRLRKADGKSKVVILLTDGINNAGKIDPKAAAKSAEAFGVRVYTIGAGTKGFAPYPVTDLFGHTVYQNVKIEVDDDMLKEVAAITGGQYFRATDGESLKDIYKKIDAMEKVKFEDIGYRQYEEHFKGVLLWALVLLLLEAVLSRTVFLKIP
ncbi:MAG: VWA domain-containing protein, partial [Candidatus Omnitrophica bacterium]|nr:VWA domain-containing protein [Candidatus Omnitrophota bacterium]